MPRDDAIIFSDLMGRGGGLDTVTPREFSVFFIHSVTLSPARRDGRICTPSQVAALSSGSFRCANCCACCAQTPVSRIG